MSNDALVELARRTSGELTDEQVAEARAITRQRQAEARRKAENARTRDIIAKSFPPNRQGRRAAWKEIMRRGIAD